MKDVGGFGGLSYHGALRQILKELSLVGSGKGEEKTRKRHTHQKKKKKKKRDDNEVQSIIKSRCFGGIPQLNGRWMGTVRAVGVGGTMYVCIPGVRL